VQAFAAKKGLASIDLIVDATVNGGKKLSREDRQEMLALAVRKETADNDRSTLMVTLFMSLRDSATRSEESVALTPQLEKLQTIQVQHEGAKREIQTYSFACIAFSFEQKVGGFELEQAWFAKVRGESVERQAPFFAALVYSKWTHQEQRFKYFSEVYADPKTDDRIRQAIIGSILGGAIFGELPLEWCTIYYRDLAKLPTHTPELTNQMFTNLTQMFHMASMISKAQAR
jgi:superfamily II helicase